MGNKRIFCSHHHPKAAEPQLIRKAPLIALPESPILLHELWEHESIACKLIDKHEAVLTNTENISVMCCWISLCCCRMWVPSILTLASLHPGHLYPQHGGIWI